MAAIVNCPRHSNLGHQWLCAKAWADAGGSFFKDRASRERVEGERRKLKSWRWVLTEAGRSLFPLKTDFTEGTKCYSNIRSDVLIVIGQEHGCFKEFSPNMNVNWFFSEELSHWYASNNMTWLCKKSAWKPFVNFPSRSLSRDSELGQQCWNHQQCHMWEPCPWDVL